MASHAQYRKSGIERRGGGMSAEIVYRALAGSVLPVVLAGGIFYFVMSYQFDIIEASLAQSRASLTEDVAGENLKVQASLAGHQIDTFLVERIAEAKSWATSSIMVKDARAGHDRHDAEGLVGLPVDEIEARFRTRKSLGAEPEADAYLRQQMGSGMHFAEVFFTDRNGFNVATTNPTSDFVQSDESWWQDAWTHGLSISEIGYDDSAGVWSLDISVRIDDPRSGEPVGVMKTVLAIDAIQRIADWTANVIPGGRIWIATTQGLLIADTSSGHARERIMNPDVNLLEIDSSSARAAFDGERSGFATDGEWITGYTLSGEIQPVHPTATGGFTKLDWIIILQSPTSRVAFVYNLFDAIKGALHDWRRLLILGLGTMAIASIVITVILANLAARRLVASLRAMREMAEHAMQGKDVPCARIEHPRELARLNEAVHRLSRICAFVTRERKQRGRS